MADPKWALITGVSAGGMGEGYVKALLDRNINVLATAIDLQLLDNLQVETTGRGLQVVPLQLNVTSAESIAAAVDRVREVTNGKLHFLFSTSCPIAVACTRLKMMGLDNAGYGYYMPLLDVDLDQAKKQYEVNVWGVLAMTQALFPLLKAGKGELYGCMTSIKPDDVAGTVINQSSMAGVQGYNRPYSKQPFSRLPWNPER
jgi:1-acylglycerone phosphate reductase